MNNDLVYLKGYANGRNLLNTLKAINYAIKYHHNQKRKS